MRHDLIDGTSDASKVIKSIVSDVCNEFSVTEEEMMIPGKRPLDITTARWFAILLVYQKTFLSHKFIGNIFARDRTTIIYSLSQALYLVENNGHYQGLYELISNKYSSKRSLKTISTIRPKGFKKSS